MFARFEQPSVVIKIRLGRSIAKSEKYIYNNIKTHSQMAAARSTGRLPSWVGIATEKEQIK